MPIRPENRDRYPREWPTISAYIRFDRAKGRCECRGECGAQPHGEGRCEACHDQPHPLTGSRVVLTVAHRDHTPENVDPTNLRAYCQRCHLAYDADEHKAQASHTRAVRSTEGMDALDFDTAASALPTDAEIDASLDEIHHRLTTCPVCRDARTQRRQSGTDVRARLARCCVAGDTDNSCPACIAAEDQHAAACLDEIRTVSAHPHTPPTADPS